jgi:tetratricopeptide (TPR) repeat protein
MELTIEQALQQGVAAHKEGKLQDAERLYKAILQSQPLHPDANHNLGVLAVSVNKADAALPLFKTALEANPKIEQFWLSYIDALIKEKQFYNAKQVLEKAKNQSLAEEKLNTLEAQLPSETQIQNVNSANPPQKQLSSLIEYYQNGRYGDAEKLAKSITQQFPAHQFGWKVLGAVLKQTGRIIDSLPSMQKSVQLAPQDAEAHSNLGVTLKELGRLGEAEASYIQAIVLKPDFAEAHYNLGNTLKELGRLDEAEASYTQVIALKPDYAEAHSNLGITLQELGRLEQAEASCTQAIALKPDLAEAHSNLGVTLQELGRLDESEANLRQAIALKTTFAEAHSNLGNTLKELGRLDEAEASYTQAIVLKPDYAAAFWNLSGCEKTIKGAEHWIDKCLIADATYLEAKLTKAALKVYRGDRTDFDNLMQSEFKQHSFMRSFSWAISLPNLPELHFNKWYFFDAIVKKSIISKPFYEFGVWRASSFKYLIKVFKKGYGFDTFTGLPEDWDVGHHTEKEGSYSSDGNVPKIKGGEFIVGKFENTLPVFFSESRPMASVINFDADLYSSTICALNFSKSVMDKDTILIFDEFLINESWEQDEFKALNEFCSLNHFSYEVIAISFFTKQVAVKLIGI